MCTISLHWLVWSFKRICTPAPEKEFRGVFWRIFTSHTLTQRNRLAVEGVEEEEGGGAFLGISDQRYRANLQNFVLTLKLQFVDLESAIGFLLQVMLMKRSFLHINLMFWTAILKNGLKI